MQRCRRSCDFASIRKSRHNCLLDFPATPAHSRPTTSSLAPLKCRCSTSGHRPAKDRLDYALSSPPACLRPPFHPFSIKSAAVATVLVPCCYCRSF
ncbi:hypothetical protein JCGZ_22701 [Jatropha curcas]|uniref:Uncharacterized protein n=1 Tax=Jatropha curcas TaxID=180498 RepID=A0A067JPS7_JATCU|nr:hypothetical protein JCGZ_22701 [Jatropha curcas]